MTSSDSRSPEPLTLPALRATITAIRDAGSQASALPVMVGGRATADLAVPIDGVEVVGTSVVAAQRFARTVAARASKPTE